MSVTLLFSSQLISSALAEPPESGKEAELVVPQRMRLYLDAGASLKKSEGTLYFTPQTSAGLTGEAFGPGYHSMLDLNSRLTLPGFEKSTPGYEVGIASAIGPASSIGPVSVGVPFGLRGAIAGRVGEGIRASNAAITLTPQLLLTIDRDEKGKGKNASYVLLRTQAAGGYLYQDVGLDSPHNAFAEVSAELRLVVQKDKGLLRGFLLSAKGKVVRAFNLDFGEKQQDVMDAFDKLENKVKQSAKDCKNSDGSEELKDEGLNIAHGVIGTGPGKNIEEGAENLSEACVESSSSAKLKADQVMNNLAGSFFVLPDETRLDLGLNAIVEFPYGTYLQLYGNMSQPVSNRLDSGKQSPSAAPGAAGSGKAIGAGAAFGIQF